MAVPMVAPAHRPIPDVKRFSSRRMEIPASRNALEGKLLEWIQEVLDYIGQNRPMDSVRPASYLVANADGIDLIMNAPIGMSVGPRTVYADFVWGRRPDGHWYIRHVKFGPHLSQAQVTEANRRALKERLLDEAETENATHYHARQVVFPAEQYIRTWHDEITRGNNHLKYLIEEIYEDAKEEASMPQNWVTPVSMGLAFVFDGGVVAAKAVGATRKMGELYRAAGVRATTVSKEAALEGLEIMDKGGEILEKTERAEKLAKTYERMHRAHIAYDAGKESLEHYSEKDEEGEQIVFKESWGDVIAQTGVDAVSLIPGVGGFVKMFAGMFTEIGLANYSGIVARIRGRVYSCFVGGFITGLTGLGGTELKFKRDRKYYALGVKRGLTLSPSVSFQYQIALMYYAMTRYTSGFWAGTTPEFHGRQAWGWNYPDEWEAKWSPELLGRSLVTLLGFKHYMIE